jgi:hypothetical protein
VNEIDSWSSLENVSRATSALTLGKAVAGLNAQAKDRRLAIFKPHEEKPTKARERERGKRFLIEER